MQFGFSLSKKRTLVVMLGLALLTSFTGSLVSDLLRTPAVWALAPVSDYVKAATSAFKIAMVNREEPGMTPAEAARLREEVELWKSVAWDKSRSATYWWDKYRRVQNTRKAFRAELKNCELIPARVVMGDVLPYGRSQTLIKGTIHGVKPGMRVVDVLTDRSKALPAGDKMRAITGYSPVSGKPITGSVLVGWVEAAGSFTARIRLVTDKRFISEAWLARTLDEKHPRKAVVKTKDGPAEKVLTKNNNRPIAVTVVGDGERRLVTTKPIPKSHNVRPGDWLWTRGRTIKLPVQLRIGRVVEVKPDVGSPNFVIVVIEPAAQLGALRDIFIVRSLVSPMSPHEGGN